LHRYAIAGDPAPQPVGSGEAWQTTSNSSADETKSGAYPVKSRNTSSPRTQPGSTQTSLSGSPPVAPMPLAPRTRSYRTPAKNFSATTSNPQTSVPHIPQNRVGRPSRTASSGGGLSVVLGETGSWSELAKQDTTLPADAKDLTAKPNGMLGFLSRKKGRGHSPKPQERGILGKEGARVVISN
jgi:serine/threonine kinase 32